VESINRKVLLTPGPATTTNTVKWAMVGPDICPREPEFSAVIYGLRRDLVKVAAGDANNFTAVLFAGSGTAVMDAALSSVVPPGAKVAIIINGAYGRRFAQIAQAYQIPYVEVNFAWGGRIDLQQVEAVLKNDPEIACVAVIHHETTTGILNPIKEIGDIAKRYNCLYVVDTISSYAGIPINITELNIDFMLSTANKCLQGMAGISFVIGKRNEIEKLKHYPPRNYYLNLYNHYRYLEDQGQMPFTAPVQVLYALRQAMAEYFAEGGENRHRRYTDNWHTLRTGLLELGFKLFLPEEDESRLLLTVYEPEHDNYSFAQMHDFLYARDFTIYPGKLGEARTFRIGNIGAIEPGDIKAFLINLKAYLDEHNIL
jgi:2-aminoethylphosphonate aminotransferase